MTPEQLAIKNVGKQVGPQEIINYIFPILCSYFYASYTFSDQRVASTNVVCFLNQTIIIRSSLNLVTMFMGIISLASLVTSQIILVT